MSVNHKTVQFEKKKGLLTLISALSNMIESFILAPGPITTPLPTETFGPICWYDTV